VSATPEHFYRERIPAQFNRALDRQRQLGESGRRVYHAMCAVDATIRIDVLGADGGTFFLNIREGQMAAEPAPAHPPFLTLIQDRRAFDRLASEAGDSALALLGGLSGIAGELVLTRTRVEHLRAVDGLVRFEVTGDDGFALGTHFGPAPCPPSRRPGSRGRRGVPRPAQRGARPSVAFMNQQIRVEGDMQAAMQLALAAVAPTERASRSSTLFESPAPEPASPIASADRYERIRAEWGTLRRCERSRSDPVCAGQRVHDAGHVFAFAAVAARARARRARRRFSLRGSRCTGSSASRSAPRSRGRARAARSPRSTRDARRQAGLDAAHRTAARFAAGSFAVVDGLRVARRAVEPTLAGRPHVVDRCVAFAALGLLAAAANTLLAARVMAPVAEALATRVPSRSRAHRARRCRSRGRCVCS
jgi:hypothetical protein